MSNRKITILGGGQAGLQLACGLLQKGYEVKLVQNRTADEIRTGRVMSSQCMFGGALANEAEIGLDFWAKECPTVDAINFMVPAPMAPGTRQSTGPASLTVLHKASTSGRNIRCG